MMKLVNTTIFYVSMVGLFLAIASMALTVSLFKKDKEKSLQQWAHYWAKALLFVNRIKVNTKGLNNIPHNGPIIFASNHQSIIDILILLAEIPLPFVFVIKKELFNIPLFGGYLKKSGHILMDRQKNIKAYQALNEAIQKVKEGHNIHVFPEGTRSPDGSLGKFKRGIEKIAKHTEAKIVPLAISGSFKSIPKGKIWFYPVSVELNFAKPLLSGNGKEDLLLQLGNSINSLLTKEGAS